MEIFVYLLFMAALWCMAEFKEICHLHKKIAFDGLLVRNLISQLDKRITGGSME